MLRETDLPCSDCGTELVEFDLPAHERPNGRPGDGTLSLAGCPECDVRYYPERTLVALHDAPGWDEAEGGG